MESARLRRDGTTEAPAPFLVSAGRSGTTLLRMMLDSHPEVAIPPETEFIPEVAAACREAEDPADAFLESVTSHWRFRDLQLDRQALAREVSALSPFDFAAGIRCLYGLYAAKFGKRRWGDKTPFYRAHMPLVQRLVPEARFVHVIRDGRDVALSITPLWFGPDSIEETASYWRDIVGEIREGGRRLDAYLEVRYEDLILETEPTLRRICDFVDLPFDRAMLDYHRRAPERVREVITDYRDAAGHLIADVRRRREIHSLLSDPPRADRIGRWRSEMAAEDVARFDAVAGTLLSDLGYEVA
jgi:hypothetical protein